MPALQPTPGGRGAQHQTDWCIADVEAGYVSPAKTLAMRAIDLLHDDARGFQQLG